MSRISDDSKQTTGVATTACNAEHLLLLLDNIPISIMSFDAQGIVNFVNQWHLSHFAKGLVPVERFLGHHVWELEGIRSAGIGDQLRPVLDGLAVRLPDVHLPRLSAGHEGYQSMHAVPLYLDGAVVGGLLIREDITDRKLAEAALKEGQERLALALDGASDGAWDWRLDSGESYFSPRYYTMLGYEPNEFEASFENFAKLVHPDDLAALGEAIKTSLKESETNSFEIRMRAKSGDWKWILTRSRVVSRSASGQPTRLTGTHMDITERKRAEELRDHVARTIYHDLRTPACSVMSIAKLLREDNGLTEEQRILLGMFEEQAHNMLDTLDSSLDIYKMESGQFHLNHETFDCLELLLKLKENLNKKFQLSGTKVLLCLDSQHLQRGEQCLCVGEPRLLRTALQNLLVNALEASAEDGFDVMINVCNGVTINIVIINKGTVPVDIRDRFFEKYITSGKRDGTGLGTYSARMLVKAMGGEVGMTTSDVLNETIVTVSMPRP